MKIISLGQHMHSFPHTNIKTCTATQISTGYNRKTKKENLPGNDIVEVAFFKISL
jgi:hypothetical protein